MPDAPATIHAAHAALTWAGILLCLLQSAIFSGCNLAFFSISRLRLEAEAEHGNHTAARVLTLRQNSHFLLSAILWGNVSANTLLALLSDSVLTGAGAFIVSTALITFLGELAPQAYFARHALRMAGLMLPVIKFYQILLFPLARPTGWLLDLLVGRENASYLSEDQLEALLLKHFRKDASPEICQLEGRGAVNFLRLDDQILADCAREIHPDSIIRLPRLPNGLPDIPEIPRHPNEPSGHPADSILRHPFIRQIHASGKKWVILADPDGEPLLALNADDYLRDLLFSDSPVDLLRHSHKPIICRDPDTRLGAAIARLCVEAEHRHDHVIDHDIILSWHARKKILTGADILGILMCGIVPVAPARPRPSALIPIPPSAEELPPSPKKKTLYPG